MDQSAKKWYQGNAVILISTLVIIVLFITAGVLPNAAIFKATILGHSLCLFLLSVWAWIFLFWIVREAQSIVKIRFTKKEIIVLMITIAVVLAYYAYNLITREFIYYWDYANYYNLLLNLNGNFQNAGFFTGVVDVAITVWYHGYSQFINVFLAAPFMLTPQTPDYFVAVSAIAILPLLYSLIAIFIKLAERILQPARSEIFFIGGMVLAAGFPLIHRALLYGQPDLFGLIFVFLIIILTMDCDFSKTDFLRYFLIIALTVMTSASRRWYMFWLAAYYVCYGFAVIVRFIRGKHWKNLVRAVLFFLIAAICVVTVLLPMIIIVLRTNFASSYSAYNIGGFPAELTRQARFLGIGLLIVLFAGFLWGIIQRKSRWLAVFALLNIMLAIFFFTRIQNMGYHHTLILVPSYFLLMLISLSGISSLKKKWAFRLSAAVVFGFSITNAVVCGASSSASLPAFFSNSALILPKRDDIEQIRIVNKWIIEHCTEPDSAYIIPHGEPYNPDIFRSCDLPDKSVSQYVPYGSAVLGTHFFPEELLLAKYVLTCEPFCNISIAKKYNSAFLSEIPQKHFIKVTQFDMGNGYIFYVYERVIPTDQEEIQFYKDYFTKEDQLFPDMFSGVLNDVLGKIK